MKTSGLEIISKAYFTNIQVIFEALLAKITDEKTVGVRGRNMYKKAQFPTWQSLSSGLG